MPTAFAIIKLPVNAVNEKGEVIGQQVKEITKAFPADTPITDLQQWARENRANGCTLWFETPGD